MKGLIHDFFKPLTFLSENRFLLFCVSYLVVTGIYQFTHRYSIVIYGMLVFLSLLSLFGKNFLTVAFLIAISTVLALGRSYIVDTTQISQDSFFSDLVTDEKKVEATIVSDPHLDHFHTEYPVQVQFDNENKMTKFLLRTDRFPRREIGDRCDLYLDEESLKTISSDYQKYLRRSGYSGIIEISKITCVTSSNISPYLKLRKGVYRFKVWATSKVQMSLFEPKASLLLGMIFGDDRLFSDSFEEALRVTGTTHIIAASGFNITVIYKSIEGVFGKFLPLKLRVSQTVIMIFLFALSANLSGSILRAVVMLFIVLLGRVTGRVVGGIEALVMSLFFIVCFLPQRVMDVGLLLSTGAMVGLIIVLPLFSSLVSKVLPKSHGFTAMVGENLFGTLSCTVGTLPISNRFFGSGSFVSVIPNLFLLPLVEYIYYLGVFALFISMIPVDYMTKIIFIPLSYLLTLFLLIIGYFTELISLVPDNNQVKSVYFVVSVTFLCVGYIYTVRTSRFGKYQI